MCHIKHLESRLALLALLTLLSLLASDVLLALLALLELLALHELLALVGFGKKLQNVNVCSIQYLQHRNILCLWIMIEFERSVGGAKPRIKYKLIQMH